MTHFRPFLFLFLCFFINSTNIVREQRVHVNPTWNANQLLCAATAFAVLLMGRDDYLDAMSRPFREEGSVISTKNQSEVDQQVNKDTSPSLRQMHLINEQLDWLSTWIFDILDCLKFIQTTTGNRTALLCIRMLQGMCRVDKHLQEASKSRYDSSFSGLSSSNQHNLDAIMQTSEEVQNLINLVWASNEEVDIASEYLKV